MIGKTLGHYQITSQLGKGGMGEVYQAKDQTLGRDVAIKVLPEEFAKDADHVARFQREAKLLASLNHPNIAAIHGLEESKGTNFLVLELVEGETLADRIKTGPIPVEESLKLALQIAEALEAAHERGVVHRDLKPANIKVTPDGKVKVLDFGLAKAFAGEQSDLNLSNSPTLSNAATQQGVILGTAAYMSPEQARGEAVDKKTDIWAFGCVLFEMLTGRGTFEGRTITDVLASVLKSEPGWNRLPPNLHPRIRWLLERCLEKEARNRCHDMADVRVDIQKAIADLSGVFVQPVIGTEARTRPRTILLWAALTAILIVIAGIVVWDLKPAHPGPPRAVTRLSFELPKDQQFSDLVNCAFALSPDGKQLVYSTSRGLCLRSLDNWDVRLIPGTEGNPQRPFFSPDGRWIGYWSETDKQLKEIVVTGGAPVVLTDAPSIGFFSWGADDTIAFGQIGKGIMRVSAKGGTPEVIVKAGNEIMFSPQILPDGASILFTTTIRMPPWIMVQSLRSGERKELFPGDTARYLPTGNIIYGGPGLAANLFAVPFDPKGLRVTGGAVSVIEGIQRGAALQYDVSDSGTLAYIPRSAAASSPGQRTLLWVDRKGKEEPIKAAPNAYRNPRVSPDGTRIALTVNSGGNTDIWIWDLARETMTRLTFNEAETEYPLWTRDGKRIAYSNLKNTVAGVSWKTADGTGEEEPLASLQGRRLFPYSWSGDGKTLILFNWSGLTFMDILVLSIEGERKLKPLLQEKYMETQPEVSRDGRWLAYTSNESGQNEIYVRPFPDVDKGKCQVSTNGGDSPLWSPDGRELFYRSSDSVMAVTMKTEPTCNPRKPEILFKGKYVSASSLSLQILHPWDISPDGKRFLMMKEVPPTEKAPAAEAPRKINIVMNWFEELKQKVPVK